MTNGDQKSSHVSPFLHPRSVLERPAAAAALPVSAALLAEHGYAQDDVAVGCLLFRKSLVGHGSRVRNFSPTGYSTLWSLPKASVAAA